MGKYTTAWEQQKKNNPYLTLSNASTAANKGSGANTVSSASANLGAGKATGGVSNPITAPKSSGGNSSGTKNSTAGNMYKALLTGAAAPKLTYTTPTVNATVPTKAETAIKAVEENQRLAAEAYKKKLASAQAAKVQSVEEEEKPVSAPVPVPAPAPAPVPEVKEPEVEEEWEEEEELSELEAYMQAIIDAQNAQAAANMQMLKNQSGVLNQQYDNNAANLYAQYRRAGLAMPEMLAGTATGIADSYTLQNNLNFQNNLVENELERASAQNQLNAQMNEIQANADLQAAQNAADWAQMAYQYKMQNQNKGGSNNNGNNTTKDETEPVNMLSSSEALIKAKQAGASYTEQLAYLQQLYYSGLITPAQYSDLKMALDPQYSYK